MTGFFDYCMKKRPVLRRCMQEKPALIRYFSEVGKFSPPDASIGEI